MTQSNIRSKEYWALEKLKALYREFGGEPRPYYKSLIKVELKNGGSYIESLVHTDLKHIKLTRKGHRSSVKVTEVMAQGKPIRFTEFTSGSLYTTQSSNQFKSMDFEAALCFKIDGDLSLKKTGSLDDGLRVYLENAVEQPTRVYLAATFKQLKEAVENGGSRSLVKTLRETLKKATGETYRFDKDEDGRGKGRSLKSSTELSEIEGLGQSELDWIATNAEFLDTDDSFYNTESRDTVTKNSVSLSENDIIDEIDQIRPNKLKPRQY